VLAVNFSLRATQFTPGRCQVCASCELFTEGNTVSPPLRHFFFCWEKKQKELLQYSFQMLSLINSFEHFHWKCNLTLFKKSNLIYIIQSDSHSQPQSLKPRMHLLHRWTKAAPPLKAVQERAGLCLCSWEPSWFHWLLNLSRCIQACPSQTFKLS
jgi:ferredoxin